MADKNKADFGKKNRRHTVVFAENNILFDFLDL